MARKLLPRILRADVPLRTKLEAVTHLTSNSGYPLVLALAILLPASLGGLEDARWWAHLLMFALCTLSVVLFSVRVFLGGVSPEGVLVVAGEAADAAAGCHELQEVFWCSRAHGDTRRQSIPFPIVFFVRGSTMSV